MAALRDQVSSGALVFCVWEWTPRKTQPGCLLTLPVEPVRGPVSKKKKKKKVFLKQPRGKFVPGFKVGSPPRQCLRVRAAPFEKSFLRKICGREPWLPSPYGKECAGEVALGRAADVSGVSAVGGSLL